MTDPDPSQDVPQSVETTQPEVPPVAETPQSPPPQSPPPPASGDFLSNITGRQWAMLLHFSQFAGYLVPGLGFAAPIVIWQVYKEKFPELDAHGKMVTNWLISLLIYSLVAGAVTFITCGVGIVLFIPIAAVTVIFPILGGIKAGEGTVWSYPVTISFIK